MKLYEAKQTLQRRLARSSRSEFSSKRLDGIGVYLSVTAGDSEATLDGGFSADELEAIAMWMRDPVGVAYALPPSDSSRPDSASSQ